ncbi:MAG: hypothetical protein L3J15_02835 [Devosiaceae bacterium]|nr:hypothetical protein [Devosiaceae bacterium]
MNLITIILSSLLLFAILYLLIIALLNRKIAPKGAKIISDTEELEKTLPQTIRLATWNIGYAGLGQESDFLIDGGKNLLAPSKKIVQKNLTAIIKQLQRIKADIFLLQEVSQKSFLSRNVDVLKGITSIFIKYFIIFRPDFASIGLPYPLKIKHGTLSLAKVKPALTLVKTLPFEPKPLGGIFHRHYALQINYFNIAGKPTQWVIINLHLAAFDENGATRQKQFDAVFAFAEQEYKKDNYVILGGDWNMELTNSNFPHKTEEKYLFWKIPFPFERLPKNWQIGIDKKTPTVRSNQKPYVAGENYTAIIDGFITSPNVQINEMKTFNNDFKYTDHLPIIGTFSTK